MSFSDAALLLLGHGSTLNADSSAPTYQHAEEIRRRGVFAEVRVAFWKEEPNFRQALRQTGVERVYVVPNFISSGYFTEQIIPRELGLSGPVSRVEGRDVFYCEPVGLHPSMGKALLRRAGEVVASSDETISDTAKTACLFICGHGTSLNDNSTKIIHEQAEKIRALKYFADCQGVLMEQAPFVRDWRKLTDCPDVIVVPFFIADGLHSFEDIPVLLGLTHNVKEKSFSNPHHEAGRRLWYATAMGTEAYMADVIVAQVEKFHAGHPEALIPADFIKSEILPSIGIWLQEFQAQPSAIWKIGEVAILPNFDLVHGEDRATAAGSLRELKSPDDLRELIRLDDRGNYRPLRAAPNLRRGWIYHAMDALGVGLALDYLYPSALANWALWREKKLAAIPWAETAARQSGRFRIVREIEDAGACELAASHCQPGCLKRRLWSPTAEAIESGALEIPLLCPEACNYLIGKAREKLKGPEEDVG